MHPAVVVVDIETSGLILGKHEVIEVGYVLIDHVPGRRDGPETQQTEKAFSVTFNEDLAEPKALEVNGWGKREFAPKLNRYIAAEQLCADFADRLVVAAPAHFDVPFLDLFIRGQGLKVPWSHRSIVDLKSWARASFAAEGDPNHPLIKGFDGSNGMMAEVLNVPQPENKHTALDDARWTADMWMVMQ